MNKKSFLLNGLLVGVLFAVLLAAILVNTFAPAAILPPMNIPNMVLLSLVTLVAEHYLSKGAEHCYLCVLLLSGASFGVLPWMAGFACHHTFWKLALVGGAVFTVTTALFDTMTDRISSGPKAHAACILSALGIYLAAQAFAGIIL